MTPIRFAAALAATLALSRPTLAESNSPAAVETPPAAHIIRGGGTDAGGGSNAYPAFAAAGSTTVIAGTALLLPENGSEGPVQTAASLPPAAMAGTAPYTQAQSMARALAGPEDRTRLAARRPAPHG